MRIAALTIALVLSWTAATASTWELELEGGAVWQSVNDVQIPNDDGGTRFSLVDVIGRGPWSAGRVLLTWNVSERHGLRALAAPLSVTEQGMLDGAVDFNGAVFAPGAAEATYMFNSYRLSYRYRFHRGESWTWWVGFTAKVRDARISLKQGAVQSAKDDLGFVPLLHLAADWRWTRNWGMTLDVDAVAGGPGRAEDVALKLERRSGDSVALSAGYRLVEGGADVDSVYSFAWLHYAVGSLRLSF